MILIDGKNNFELKKVISIYAREREFGNDALNLTYYLEQSDVEVRGRVAKILPGQPLTEQSMFSLGSFLRSRDKNIKMRKGLLPDNLMYIDSEYQTYIWYKNEHRSNILFDKDTGIPDGPFNHPHLLFKANHHNLWVMAITDKKPSINTTLHNAPYLNLHENGNMCKGDINTELIYKTDTHAEFMKAWEGIFFNSRFSAGLGQHSAFKKEVADNRKLMRFNYKTLTKQKTSWRKLKDLIPS